VSAVSASALQSTLAQARQALARGDATAAHDAFQRAHLLRPGDATIRLDLAVACLACGAPAQALPHALAAAQQGDSWRLQMVLAGIHQRLQQADAAAWHLQQALGHAELPTTLRADALQQQAGLQLNAFGDARGAARSLRAAARCNPAMALEADLADLVADLYGGGRSGAELAAGFAALAQRLPRPQPDLGRPARRGPRRAGRLRIGLLSQQFCASPVGFLTLGALGALGRSADLLFFDRGAKADWAQALFQASAHQWLACAGLDSNALLQRLIEADLDAVIDLSGWTDPVALAALTARPAPRQLKWVGGQALSTGLSCFDGFVTDRRQVPAAAAPHYSEPLLFARNGYVSYSAPPYAPQLAAAAAQPPAPAGRPAAGVFALVSNPAKISHATADALRRLKPRKLLLLDQRWRHQGTRAAAQDRLGSLLDDAEFITPNDHPTYLQALAELDASFVDSAPYAMGLTAIELRLLGKHITAPPRDAAAPMCQRHCVAHLGARRFDHHAGLAAQLLQWCQA
jgi:hypothetical protein